MAKPGSFEEYAAMMKPGAMGQAFGAGGAVTMGNVSLSNTAQANYMNAATVTA